MVDIPSAPSDSGELGRGESSLTVTFAAPKYGHVLPPACDQVGALIVADIGIPATVLAQTSPSLWLAEERDAAKAYPPRAPGAHKGTFGHVLVAAGAVGKTGAAILAATGALVSGAGLVTVATPAPALPIVAHGRPELMTEPARQSAADREAAADGVARPERDARSSSARPARSPCASLRERLRAYEAAVDADNAWPAPSASPRDGCAAPGPPCRQTHPGDGAPPTAEVQRRRLRRRAPRGGDGLGPVLKGQRTMWRGRTAPPASNHRQSGWRRRHGDVPPDVAAGRGLEADGGGRRLPARGRG